MNWKKRIKGDFLHNEKGGFFEKEAWGGMFDKPNRNNSSDKFLVAFAAILVIALAAGALFFYNKSTAEIVRTPEIRKISNANPWYALKLLDGEIVYGKINDIQTDPLIIESVYYNYDQKRTETDGKTTKKPLNETGDLRLVKRGNETHGPDGRLQIFRAQVVYMENLRADSKVLRVIEENEK